MEILIRDDSPHSSILEAACPPTRPWWAGETWLSSSKAAGTRHPLLPGEQAQITLSMPALDFFCVVTSPTCLFHNSVEWIWKMSRTGLSLAKGIQRWVSCMHPLIDWIHIGCVLAVYLALCLVIQRFSYLCPFGQNLLAFSTLRGGGSCDIWTSPQGKPEIMPAQRRLPGSWVLTGLGASSQLSPCFY